MRVLPPPLQPQGQLAVAPQAPHRHPRQERPHGLLPCCRQDLRVRDEAHHQVTVSQRSQRLPALDQHGLYDFVFLLLLFTALDFASLYPHWRTLQQHLFSLRTLLCTTTSNQNTRSLFVSASLFGYITLSFSTHCIYYVHTIGLIVFAHGVLFWVWLHDILLFLYIVIVYLDLFLSHFHSFHGTGNLAVNYLFVVFALSCHVSFWALFTCLLSPDLLAGLYEHQKWRAALEFGRFIQLGAFFTFNFLFLFHPPPTIATWGEWATELGGALLG